MRLKNDIQIKAFLIRNKIPFDKFESFLQVDESMLGEATINAIMPYEYKDYKIQAKRGPKPTKMNWGAKYRNKEKVVIKEIIRQPEKKEVPFTRIKGVYSNKNFTEL